MSCSAQDFCFDKTVGLHCTKYAEINRINTSETKMHSVSLCKYLRYFLRLATNPSKAPEAKLTYRRLINMPLYLQWTGSEMQQEEKEQFL